MIGFLFQLMLWGPCSPFLRRLEGAQRNWIACVGAIVVRWESLHGRVVVPSRPQTAAKKRVLKKGNCPSSPLKTGIFPVALVFCMFRLITFNLIQVIQ